MLSAFLSLFFVSLNSCSHSQPSNSKPVEPVAAVDLNRYQGLWFEFASIENSFQDQCIADTKAEYSLLPDGLVEVKNSCLNKDGEIESVTGRAKVVNRSNSQLKVTFARIFGKWVFAFGGDYWVLALDKDYSWAFVGTPNRKFGWVLSRTPALYSQELSKIKRAIEEQGYNPCDFVIKALNKQGEATTESAFCNQNL